ncbi:hypothetical protein BDE02_02G130400 [Populus trichocarpa]|nr:hypothetical protein BDE02_02G130400 [Populus trichocarpa]
MLSAQHDPKSIKIIRLRLAFRYINKNQGMPPHSNKPSRRREGAVFRHLVPQQWGLTSMFRSYGSFIIFINRR